MTFSRHLPTLLPIMLLALLTHCNTGNVVVGTGPVEERVLEIPPFDAITVRGAMDVRLTRSNEQAVKVEAQGNLIDLLSTDVTDGTWTISAKENYTTRKRFVLHIALPRITGITIQGSGDVEGPDVFEVDHLDLEVKGSGDLKIGVQAQSIAARIKGSGDMELRGNCGSLSASVQGSGDLDAGSLTCVEVNALVQGSGDITVHATDQLTARVQGSGDIRYKGDPAQVEKQVNGSGDIKRWNK
jgi:hypothetical protein